MTNMTVHAKNIDELRRRCHRQQEFLQAAKAKLAGAAFKDCLDRWQLPTAPSLVALPLAHAEWEALRMQGRVNIAPFLCYTLKEYSRFTPHQPYDPASYGSFGAVVVETATVCELVTPWLKNGDYHADTPKERPLVAQFTQNVLFIRHLDQPLVDGKKWGVLFAESYKGSPTYASHVWMCKSYAEALNVAADLALQSPLENAMHRLPPGRFTGLNQALLAKIFSQML